MQEMLDGVSQFQTSDYQHTYSPHKPIWSKGHARLLDFGIGLPEDAPLLFCIPSLINKASVFDLIEGYSMVEYMLAQGIRPILVDWGEPGFRERLFDCAEYTSKFALDALKHARRNYTGPIITLGYCMGGLFAAALSHIAPEKMDGLILLATPWDFHSPDSLKIPLDEEQRAELRSQLHTQDTVPKGWMEWAFHLMQPYQFQDKFNRFQHMNAEEKQHFIAMEHWVIDGVALSPKVAEECLLSWPQDNLLQHNEWTVKGATITPKTIEHPTLAIIPQEDRIVPPKCAKALAQHIPDCQVIEPNCGHVSMVAGKRALDASWKPITSWIKVRFAA